MPDKPIQTNSSTIPLGNLNNQEFIKLALEAIEELQWHVKSESIESITAITDSSTFLSGELITISIDASIATIESKPSGLLKFDGGANKTNIADFISTYSELYKAQYGTDDHSLLDEQNENSKAGKPAFKRKHPIKFLTRFKPTKLYFVTPILIFINIAVYILMVINGVNFFNPDTQDLINWGANYTPYTVNGELWRLFTCCFLHLGILFLLVNMCSLAYIGSVLEPMLGQKRYILAYILCCLISSMTSLWWHDIILSVGTGAILGMFGLYIALISSKAIILDEAEENIPIKNIIYIIVINIVFGLSARIDNAANIGGLLSGLFIGYSFYPAFKQMRSQNFRYGLYGAITVFILVVSFILYYRIPKDIAIYGEKFKEFTAKEIKALHVYALSKDTPKDTILAEIRTIGIPYWNDNFKLITELEKLNIPDQYHQTNKQLLKYCNLRIKSYNLFYKATEENTEVYNDSLEYYYKEIIDITDNLKKQRDK